MKRKLQNKPGQSGEVHVPYGVFLCQEKVTNQAVTSKTLQMQRYLPPSIILTWIQVVKTVLVATAPPVQSASA